MNADHPAATTSRQIPEDLRQNRYRHGYVVTVCDGSETAATSAQALVDAGFSREELVLVSSKVHSLQAGWPGEDSLEVTGPASATSLNVRVAAALTAGTTGGLLGVAAAFFADVGGGSTWRWALVGAAVGALLGLAAGRLAHRVFTRRLARYYDGHLSGEEVLVGIGLGAKRDPGTRARARLALEARGQTVLDLAP